MVDEAATGTMQGAVDVVPPSLTIRIGSALRLLGAAFNFTLSMAIIATFSLSCAKLLGYNGWPAVWAFWTNIPNLPHQAMHLVTHDVPAFLTGAMHWIGASLLAFWAGVELAGTAALAVVILLCFTGPGIALLCIFLLFGDALRKDNRNRAHAQAQLDLAQAQRDQWSRLRSE